MNVCPIFSGRISGGRFVLNQRDEFAALVAKLEGKDVEITLRRHRKQRSPNQNRYLHGVVIPMIAEHLGWEPDEMKDAMKYRFLRIDDGEHGLPRMRSTADLSTAEMTEFIEQIRRFAAELGCSIPSPNEVA